MAAKVTLLSQLYYIYFLYFENTFIFHCFTCNLNQHLHMRFIFCFYLLIASFSLSAQNLSPEEKRILDSLIANDPLLEMLGDQKKNELDIGIGFSNGVFSSQNPAINATGTSNVLVLSPALFYSLKNGLFMGATMFVAAENNQLNAYQAGLTFGYQYLDKSVKATVSYTRNLANFKKYNGKATYKYEIFGDIASVKGWLNFGANLGFANGSFNTVAPLVIPPNTPIINNTSLPKTVQDSIKANTNYVSFSPYLEHAFEYEKIFGKRDFCSITPRFMVNMGSDKLTEQHTNANYERFLNSRFAAKRGITAKVREQNNKFQFQSFGLNTAITYGIDKFYIQPNVYLDYYLGETDTNRFSAFFSLSAGFTF